MSQRSAQRARARARWQSVTITMQLERDDEDDVLELTVEGVVEPFTPANFSGPPDNWCPAEGGDVEITSIKLDSGDVWDGTLTDDEADDASEQLRQAANEFDPY